MDTHQLEDSKTEVRPLTKRSIQEYIDETPSWSDGTETSMTPMTSMQWRIWWLAAAGKFFEGLVVFMTGVALPLIASEFSLSAAAHGAVSAATLAGILVGATALGGMADLYGRKVMFIVEMVLFIAFLVALTFSPNFTFLVICLFGLGVSLGCDYPTAHMIISESISSKARGKLVLAAFGFQAVGALAGTAVGFLILGYKPDIGAWRLMYASAVVPAAFVLIARFFITESPHWLLSMGRKADAERETQRLLWREPLYPKQVALHIDEDEDAASDGEAHRNHEHQEHHQHHHKKHHHKEKGYLALFKHKNRRATILASVPWFLQDLGTYGIGIFTPTILASVIGKSREHAMNVADLVQSDLVAAEGAAFIDVLLIVGVVFAVMLADVAGRIRLQVIGFIGCALGLLLASLSVDCDGPTKTLFIFLGFMMFSFMTNMGPNAQTYLLAGEVFPTHVRGKGAGFAASFAKLGAVLTAFLFPVLLADIGTRWLLYGLVATSLLGAVVTWIYRIETTGVNLESIGNE
ncbi:MAG: MFS transporter [Gemmataceae bacterium]